MDAKDGLSSLEAREGTAWKLITANISQGWHRATRIYRRRALAKIERQDNHGPVPTGHKLISELHTVPYSYEDHILQIVRNGRAVLDGGPVLPGS